MKRAVLIWCDDALAKQLKTKKIAEYMDTLIDKPNLDIHEYILKMDTRDLKTYRTIILSEDSIRGFNFRCSRKESRIHLIV